MAVLLTHVLALDDDGNPWSVSRVEASCTYHDVDLAFVAVRINEPLFGNSLKLGGIGCCFWTGESLQVAVAWRWPTTCGYQ